MATCSPQHNNPGDLREAGLSAILLVLVLMFFVGAVYASVIARMNLDSHQAFSQDKATYIQRAQAQLQHWYAENATIFDANGNGSASPFSASEILAQAGIQTRWNAQLFISTEQCIAAAQGNNICYHTLWLAVPSLSGAAPTLQNNQFQANGAVYVAVSGQAVETQHFNHAVTQITTLSTLLESGAASANASGGVHDANLDWFAPSGCGNGDGPWPSGACGTMSWLAYAQNSGLTAAGNGDNPWGLSLAVTDSGGNANNTSAPYTIELQSPLPWGGAITQIVTEPL